MLKKTIVYENPFTNEQVSEEHYFHISKADLVQMEMEEHSTKYEKDGETLTGMQAKLQRIVDSQDGKAIMEEIRDLIRRSFGKKDGDRFLKSPEIWNDFASTEAYSQLIFDLCTNAEAAAEFMNNIIPHNLEQIADDIRVQAQAAAQANGGDTAQPPPGPRPEIAKTVVRVQELEAATPEKPVTLTDTELREIDTDDLRSGLATGRYKLN